MLEEANLSKDSVEVANGISDMYNAVVLQKDKHDHLIAIHKTSFKRLSESSLPMFEAKQLPSTYNEANIARSSITSFVLYEDRHKR